ncbi:serine hydrolase [Nonomuraea sp. NEAU-A123]|uniref:serine hydrolase domain-containing protein n=1 Tax=Nonomuraea sp. NEAU-A123 TaxID=2839649 RepID=UPI001BE3E38C|nr:serine hydrolase domain-containing protein [Nonomuraea sp. NEAU-A123]MBT2232996.1 serine hydrolase [Nonomuraea sp. NEAU-A123]
MSDRLDAILADGVPRVCSAAVALIAVDGSVAASAATGELVRYADAEGTLAADRPPAGRDAIFDLASISKLFTTAVVLSLVEEGLLDLDEPVAAWLPAGDRRVTLRRLLTHTAGLQPTRRIDLELPDADPATRMAAMINTPVTGPIGGPYLYTDVGMVMVGRIAELAGGAPLDALVGDRVTGVLGLADTGYRPGPATLPRVAATEWKPERQGAAATDGTVAGWTPEPQVPGCVRGEVHDETAYGLGGVAGHAGVFATADDLLTFGETLRLGGGGLLRPETTAEMLRDQGAEGAAFRHGLGVRIGDPAIVGPLGGAAFGHSGFTGTSLVVDPARGLTVVLLTNAVHPVRGRDGIRALRHAVAGEALRLAG